MPSYDDILAAVYEVLKPFTDEGQSLDEDTELVADLNLDSVKVMELLLNIEDRFDISIPLNILPEVRTVKDLAEQIRKVTEHAS
jgi:acyl carrier protein